MATITISRQMGSLGSRVARETADQLGYRLLWRELINQAAKRSGTPEMALAAMDELGLLNIRTSNRAIQAYRVALEQVVLEQAQEGNVVIVGRAGQAILGSRPDVLHVRVIAPLLLRAERQAVQAGVSWDSALAQVEASDLHRARFLRRFYQVKLDDPLLYHLVINTGNLSVSQAAGLIVFAARQIDSSTDNHGE